MPQQPFHPTATPVQRAVRISIQFPHQTLAEVESSAEELSRLAEGLGMSIVRTERQRRTSSNTAQLLGEGKLEELANWIGAKDTSEDAPEPAADLVLVDTELSPGQQRHLERALGVEVWDRTEVILTVFEQRARTQLAQLQVKIARLKYELPRLRDTQTRNDRQGGGGRGGRGHTNVELAKQRHREQLMALQKELAQEQARSAASRAGRKHTRRVALVGYTNAGKSSWMRSLTASQVLVEDKLFATLGTTVRTLYPEANPRVLISDTVGFIDHLPHELIASFQSTLDEAREASLLLLVLDASDPQFPKHLQVTQETLSEIGATEVPSQLLFNKVDRLSAEQLEELRLAHPDALFASAHAAEDVKRVRQALLDFFDETRVEALLLVPFDQGKVLGDVFERARVIEQRHTESGTLLRVKTDAETLERWRRTLPEPDPETLAAAPSEPDVSPAT